MAIDKVDFNAVDEADLQSLKEAGVPEGLSIEYKSAIYAGGDSAREFLKDLSSFANTIGGHLLLGVVEDQGLPTEIRGLPGVDIDQEMLRLEHLAQSIEPRVRFQMRRIRLEHGQDVIAIRIPQSWAAPHRVIHQKSNRFWKRHSTGSYEASLDELRTMFNATADIAAKVEAFRRERIRLIRGNALGRRLLEPGFMVMHVMPAASIGGRQQIDLSVAEQHQQFFQPLETSFGHSFRYNLDGAITERGRPTLAGYTQIFRNGLIESAKGGVLNDARKVMSALNNERAAIVTLRRIVAGLEILNVPPPFFVGLSLLHAGPAYYRTPRYDPSDDVPPILHSEEILLPVGQVEAFGPNEVIDAGLRPAFDALWNSAGFPVDEWFDQKGEWKQPPDAWEA